MNSSPGWIAAGLLAAALLAWALSTARAVAATETLVHGPFEIVAEQRRESDGRFPNTSANPFGTIKVTSFRVRHQGRAVTVPRRDDVLSRYWRVLRLLDAPRPALLVATTDFHLVTEENGQLVVRSIGEQSTDLAMLQWLDATPGGQPGAPLRFGIEEVGLAAGTALKGGRWLKLSFHSVLDVQTLQVHPVRPWTPHDERGAAQPKLHGAQHPVVSFAPGRSAFAVTAHGRDAQGDYDGLLVVDLASGDALGQRIERRRMRYVDSHDFTPDWVAHYFRWERDSAGKERLVPNAAAKPLPWSGRFIDFSADMVEYRVKPVRDELLPVLQRFLIERHGAEPVAEGDNPARSNGSTLKLPGCSHVLVLSYGDRHLGLYGPALRNGLRPPDCQQAIRRLGAAFDAELASGRYDELFIVD